MLLFATATALLNGSRGLRLLFDYSVVQPRPLISAILAVTALLMSPKSSWAGMCHRYAGCGDAYGGEAPDGGDVPA